MSKTAHLCTYMYTYQHAYTCTCTPCMMRSISISSYIDDVHNIYPIVLGCIAPQTCFRFAMWLNQWMRTHEGGDKLPMHPHALGDDMEVPFINWLLWKVHLGTEVTAPPGAVIVTPLSPSSLNHNKWPHFQVCEILDVHNSREKGYSICVCMWGGGGEGMDYLGI